MHTGEQWQDYSLAGTPLKNGGYDSSLGNPSTKFSMLVGAVDIWFYRRTASGRLEVLFQHRSETVDKNAGKWDVSAAGHMNYGETIPEAAIREIREEIGAEVTEKDLQYIFSVRSIDGKNLVNHYLLCDWTEREDEFHFDDREVSEVKWVPFSRFDKFINENVKDPVKNATFARALSKAWIKELELGRSKKDN